jgi:hypothetical protein
MNWLKLLLLVFCGCSGSRAHAVNDQFTPAGAVDAGQPNPGKCGLPSADQKPWRDVFATLEPFPKDNAVVRVSGTIRHGQVGVLVKTACRGPSEQMSIYVYPADPVACVPFDETVAVEGEVHLPTEEERGMTADGPGFTLRNARFVGVVSHDEVCRRSR